MTDVIATKQPKMLEAIDDDGPVDFAEVGIWWGFSPEVVINILC